MSLSIDIKTCSREVERWSNVDQDIELICEIVSEEFKFEPKDLTDETIPADDSSSEDEAHIIESSSVSRNEILSSLKILSRFVQEYDSSYPDQKCKIWCVVSKIWVSSCNQQRN